MSQNSGSREGIGSVPAQTQPIPGYVLENMNIEDLAHLLQFSKHSKDAHTNSGYAEVVRGSSREEAYTRRACERLTNLIPDWRKR